MPSIYVAGPFFNPEQKKLYEDTVSLVEKYCNAYNVLRDGIFCPPNADIATQQKAFDINANKIEECDALVAILDYVGVNLLTKIPADYRNSSDFLMKQYEDHMAPDPESSGLGTLGYYRQIHLPDTGTVWEMGAAYMSRKPVIGLMTSKQKVNLMLARGTVCIANSFEQLHRVLPILVPALDDENKLPSAIIELRLS